MERNIHDAVIDCHHYRNRSKDGGTCLIGKYEGKPSHGICAKCIQSGQNTEQSTPQKSDFKVTFKKKGCGSCKPIEVVY